MSVPSREVNLSSRSIQAVLRVIADVAEAKSDAELLHRYVTEQSDSAFAQLVRRHGRLVWAVCRSLSRDDSEADDAFQATFLVLIRNAKKIRDPAKLSIWLHGVAYRVCNKSRESARRRSAREAAGAIQERNGHALPESAWDRALAAVHEEVAKLPDSLRIPFVLCCLEGKGVTDAAAQLGWKLGTLSGRLTRAKDAVLARLSARGLTCAVIAGVGLSVPPASAIAKTAALVRAHYVIPTTVLSLSQGVIGMSAKPIKFLFAAVAVACGLGISVGGGWLATADAQQPPAKNDPQAEIKRLQAELDKATRLVQQQAEAARAAERAALADLQKAAEAQRWRAQEVKEKLAEQRQNDSYTAKTTKWEYDFVVISPMDQTRFMKFLQDKENRGWDYHGTTKFIDPKGECWVFRRPAKGAVTPKITHLKEDRLFDFTDSARINDAKVVEAEIAKLQHRLNQLQGGRAVITRDQSPLEPGELVELLQKLAEKQPKIGKLRLAVDAATKSVMIEGDAAAVAWAQSVVKKLAEK